MASAEELTAVSMLSWITPMMKPTPTTCMEMLSEIPKREQAMGMSSREPPVTPEAPQAARAERKERTMAVGRETSTPRV